MPEEETERGLPISFLITGDDIPLGQSPIRTIIQINAKGLVMNKI
jgi:hypothetical protein